MKISQKMIAELSGVSRGTIDRVLHGKPNVKPETRQRVLAAIEKLKYSPNTAGRALALSKREYSICAVLPDNPFFSDVMKGIQAALAELSDYNISFSCIYTNGKSNAEIIRLISENESNAFAVALGDSDDIRECIKAKTDRGIPFVTFNTDIKDCGRICFVGQDLYKSGRIAASLMLKMLRDDTGRILIVSGNSKYKAHRERVSGFTDALKASGRDITVSEVVETDDDKALTYSRVMDALKKHPDTDGIYVASASAEAFYSVLCELGKRYRVVVNDLLPSVREGLMDGTFDFSIFQNPFEQGYRPIKILFNYLVNKRLPETDIIYTDNTVITGEML
ncbi:MAG: LacI family DNA-binding transcriptional regulator [Clostridia bacterium]|nr:LacI family DNA-binding transcriptional regulator [Clostridia bacterium]